MRRTTTLLVGLGLLTLSACTGPTDPPTPPPSPTATSTPTPTPSLPAMPQAAKAHTKAGAKAFVEYFWEVVNYAQATGDTDAIRALIIAESCQGCVRGIASIDKVYRSGGVILGGESTVSRFRTTTYSLGNKDQATVEYDIRVAAARFDYPGSNRDNSDPATSARNRLRLAAQTGSEWRVVLMEPAT